MRLAFIGVLLLLLTLSPSLAQDPPAAPTELEFGAHGYPVKVKSPAGWTAKISKPTSSGSWVNLADFEEPSTRARLRLSAQAAAYRNAEDMIKSIQEQFQKDAAKAVLATEVRAGGGRVPKHVFFEYTQRGSAGPEHAIRAYWFHGGKRYRIYGTVREVGWRSVEGAMGAFIKSLAFTGRIFRKDPQNFTDEGQNYRIYFPESWSIRLPAKGARVEFKSPDSAHRVRCFLLGSRGSLAEDTAMLEEYFGSGSGKADGLTREGPMNHPLLGIKVVQFDYTKRQKGTTYKYREVVTTHASRLYRIVLIASERSFDTGVETFEQIVSTLSFLR